MGVWNLNNLMLNVKKYSQYDRQYISPIVANFYGIILQQTIRKFPSSDTFVVLSIVLIY